MRSDDAEVFRPGYTGVRTAMIGEVVVEFVYGVGVDTYAVNLCRKGTPEVVRLTAPEWETLLEVGHRIRIAASGRDDIQWGGDTQ